MQRRRSLGDLATALSLAESTKPSGSMETPTTAEGKLGHSQPEPAVGMATASSSDHHRSEKSSHHRKETFPTHRRTTIDHQNSQISASDASRHHKMQRRRSLGDLPREPQEGEQNMQRTLHLDVAQEHHRPQKSEHHRLEKSLHHRTERPAAERNTHRRRHADSDLEMAISLSLAQSTKPSGLKDTTISGEELAAHAAVVDVCAVGVSALASNHKDPSEKSPHHMTEKPPTSIDFSDAGRHHKIKQHRSRGDLPHQEDLINQAVPHRPEDERSMHRRRNVDSDLEKALVLSLAESSTKPVGLKDPPKPGSSGSERAAFLQPQEHHRSEKSAHPRRGRPAESSHRRRHIDSDLEKALALSLAESTTPSESGDSPPTETSLQNTTQENSEEKKLSTTSLTTKKRLKPISAMTEKEQLAFALRASIMEPELQDPSRKELLLVSGAASACAERSMHRSQGITRGRTRSPQRDEIKNGHSATRSKHA